MSNANSKELRDFGALFDEYMLREFADHDIDATMETMVPEPYVHWRSSNGPISLQVQRVCHPTLPWLISFSLDAYR